MRGRMTALALCLAGCSAVSAQAPHSPETRCRVDADCVVAYAMPSCGPCGGCQGAPIGLSRRWLDGETRRCAAERAAAERRDARARARGEPVLPPPACSPCPPPPSSASRSWEAFCHDRTCGLRQSDAGTTPPRTLDDLLAPGS